MSLETSRRRRRLRLSSRVRRFVSSKPKMLGLGVGFVAVLVLLEWKLNIDYSLGILYVFPVMIAGTVLTSWEIVLAAILCAYTRGVFINLETPLEHVLRFGMAAVAYIGCGLLIRQITESRRNVLKHYASLRFEQRLRLRAEEQLRLLAQSSPAAILTISSRGEVLAANTAAEEIFGAESNALWKRSIDELVPLFAEALRLPEGISGVRTQASAWAHRLDGQQFPATTWFSIYGEGEDKRLAAILVDVSTEVREREQAHFDDLVRQGRVLAGAVSHEIRNLCAAIAVVHRNLAVSTALQGNEDFEALSRMTAALSQISTFDLRNNSRAHVAPLSLQDFSAEFRVIIGQDWEDAGGVLEWRIPASFPAVQAERQSLLRVLLNLSRNSLRAVEDLPEGAERRFLLEAEERAGAAVLRVSDTGPGLGDPERVFQPFQTGDEENGNGLGLYISRAIAKSFGGDLHYVPTATGCTFELTLRAVAFMRYGDPATLEVAR
ncbi:MAG: ATP-binding protein [Acidobacteriaceae bacterium]|nr:ATP-binding protein [Acidobacteriaceae bacterium]